MRFDRFMELALYHPDNGYYAQTREQPQTGREGDFFTSVSVGPLFGRLLGRQFFQMWQLLEKPGEFWVIEQGAHDGRLACDILEWCRVEVPPFFKTIRYAIIEPSKTSREAQKKSVEKAKVAGSITWFDALASLKECPLGIFLSNELVDSFPVRVITHHSGKWQEKRVTVNEEGAFAWTIQPLEGDDLTQAIHELPLLASEGYTTEVNLRAREWMREVASVMKRGYVVTIDYGFSASIYYAPFRAQGTLTGYKNHQHVKDILAEPGQCDITAHVDFSALARSGKQAGWKTLGFIDQQRFLMGVARTEFSGAIGPQVHIGDNQRAWNTLTHPEFLGTRFQVLLQAKDVPEKLDGLQFVRNIELD